MQDSAPRDKMAPYHQLAASLFSTETEDSEIQFLQAVKDGSYTKVEQYLSRSRACDVINVDLRDVTTGSTPLILAAKKGDLKTVQLLLKYGADVTLRNYDNRTASDVTGSRGIKQAIHDSVSRVGSIHRHLLQAAWQGNHAHVQKTLSDSTVDINCQNSDGLSALHLVVRDLAAFEKMAPPLHKNYNPVLVLKDLIHRRGDVNLRDKDSKTPLHYVAQSKSPTAVQICQMLLDEGSSLEASDRQSFSPLHAAAKSGTLEVVRALLKGGASVSARAYAGYTPLHVAAIRCDERICRELIQHGADITVVDDTGNSPMELTKSKQLRTYLQKIWVEKTQKNVEQNLRPVRPPASLAPGGSPYKGPGRGTPREGAMAAPSLGNDRSSPNLLDMLSPRQGECSPTFSRRVSMRRELSDVEKADQAETQMWKDVSQGKYNPPASRDSYRSSRGGLQTFPTTKSTDRSLNPISRGMKVWRSASFDLPDQERDNLSIISPLPRIGRGSTTPIDPDIERPSRMSFDFLHRRKSISVPGRDPSATPTAPTPDLAGLYDEFMFRGRSSSKTCLEDLEDVPLPNIIPLRTPCEGEKGRDEKTRKMATIDEEMRLQESAKECRLLRTSVNKGLTSSSEVKLSSDGEEISPSSSSDKDSLDRAIASQQTKPEAEAKHGGGPRKEMDMMSRLRQAARDNAQRREEAIHNGNTAQGRDKVADPKVKVEDKIVINNELKASEAIIAKTDVSKSEAMKNNNPVTSKSTNDLCQSTGSYWTVTQTNLSSVAEQQVKSDAGAVAKPVAKGDLISSKDATSSQKATLTSNNDNKNPASTCNSVAKALENATKSKLESVRAHKENKNMSVATSDTKAPTSVTTHQMNQKQPITPRNAPIAQQQRKDSIAKELTTKPSLQKDVGKDTIVASAKSKAVTTIQVLPVNDNIQEPKPLPRSKKLSKSESEPKLTSLESDENVMSNGAETPRSAKRTLSRRRSQEVEPVATPRTKLKRSNSLAYGQNVQNVSILSDSPRARANSDANAVADVSIPRTETPRARSNSDTATKPVKPSMLFQVKPVSNIPEVSESKPETTKSQVLEKTQNDSQSSDSKEGVKTEKVSSAKSSKSQERKLSGPTSVFEVKASPLKMESRPKTGNTERPAESPISDSAKRRETESAKKVTFAGESAKSLAKSAEKNSDLRTSSGSKDRTQVVNIIMPGNDKATIAQAHFGPDGQIAISSAGKDRNSMTNRLTQLRNLTTKNFAIIRSGSGNAVVSQNDPKSTSRSFAKKLENAVNFYSGDDKKEEKATERRPLQDVPLALLARPDDAEMDDATRALANMNARYEAAVEKVNLWREKSDQQMSRLKPDPREQKPIQTPVVSEMYKGYESPWSKPQPKPDFKRDNSKLTRADTNLSSKAPYSKTTNKVATQGARPKTQDSKRKVEVSKTTQTKNKNQNVKNPKNVKKNVKKKTKGKAKEEEATELVPDFDPQKMVLIGGTGWHVVADMDESEDVISVGKVTEVANAASEVRLSPETTRVELFTPEFGLPNISPTEGGLFFNMEPGVSEAEVLPFSPRPLRVENEEITPRNILPKIDSARPKSGHDENLNEIINEILTITSDHNTLNDSITNSLRRKSRDSITKQDIYSPQKEIQQELRTSWDSDEGTIKADDLPLELNFESPTVDGDQPIGLDINFANFDMAAIDPHGGVPDFNIYSQMPGDFQGFKDLAEQITKSAPANRFSEKPPARPPSATNLSRHNSRCLSMSFKEIKQGRDIFRSQKDPGSEHSSFIPEQLSYSSEHQSLNDPDLEVLGAVPYKPRSSSRQSTGSSSETPSSARDETIAWTKGNMLGRGAYGTVWCGLLTEFGGLIAVKQIEMNMHDQDKAAAEYEKIQEEVDMLKTLKHGNIVSFYGTSLDEGVVSIFMEFVPGGSIASLLARFGALKEAVFCYYTKQILEGVEYIHSKGVVHRDIKGANVMLTQDGIIKLIDFGCAKHTALGGTAASDSQNGGLLKSMRGTPYWMAPEVIRETGHGKPSDIWSIGCTVFEMATRKPPWSEMNRMAAIFAIGSDYPVPTLDAAEFSEDALDFVHKCLTRDVLERSSATQLLQHAFIVKGGQIRNRKTSQQKR